MSHGAREIAEEQRRVEGWAGWLCSDAYTNVTVNLSPLHVRPMREAVARLASFFRISVSPEPIRVPGARRAVRLDAPVDGNGPAEPQQLTTVIAESDSELLTLTIRAWPRDDVRREVERMLRSFEVRSSNR